MLVDDRRIRVLVNIPKNTQLTLKLVCGEMYLLQLSYKPLTIFCKSCLWLFFKSDQTLKFKDSVPAAGFSFYHTDGAVALDYDLLNTVFSF